jgi:enoyl-CoA hydratase
VTIEVSDEGPLRIITIARPDCRNAVDPATAEALRESFAGFDRDDRLRVAILTGAGGTFCSGFDLRTVGQAGRQRDPAGDGPMGPTRMLLSKPVIAAVEGHAVAGGLELALWCDLRVASRSAVFGVFCRRWGVPLIDGGTVRLPRIVGQGRALDLILTGRPVAADEALAMGLANRLVPAGQALAEARTLALQIAAFPQLCLQADRLSAYRQFDLDLDEALRAEGRGGEAPLRAEALAGASRFVGGEGRGGRFD